MSPGEIASYGQIANTIGIVGLLAFAIVAIWRGWFITKEHHDDVIRQKDAQLAEKEQQIAQMRDLYRASTDYAQRRGDTLHTEKEQLLRQLEQNTQSVFRFTDVIGELRDAVRDLTRLRDSR